MTFILPDSIYIFITLFDLSVAFYTGDGNQSHPQEKEMQKGEMVVLEGLTNN